MSEGQAYLIQAFLSAGHCLGFLTTDWSCPQLTECHWSGLATISYAPISSAEADVFDTLDLDSLTFDTSALLPAEVRRDSRGKLFIPGLEVIDIRFTDKAGKFGTAGIGSILQGVLGDPLFLEGGQIG